MAMLQMQRICICALKTKRKSILEFLQRQGVLEISDDMPEDKFLRKSDPSTAQSLLTKNISIVTEALEILEKYKPEKKSHFAILKGRVELMAEKYDEFSLNYGEVLHKANIILTAEKKIGENRAEILKVKAQSELLMPWASLDIPIDFAGTKTTRGFIGTLPKSFTREELYDRLAVFTPVYVEIISESKDQTCIFVLCKKDKTELLNEELRSLGFSYPNATVDLKTQEQLNKFKEQIQVLELEINYLENDIVSYASTRDELKFLHDYEVMRADKYVAISHLLHTDKVFILNGYVPKIEADELARKLTQQYDAAVEIEDPKRTDDVPVLLKNNAFANPLESTVAGFSPPGKDDVDPTFIMSLFYYLLFGLMLSDAGYGAIMAIGCGIGLMKFRLTMEESMKKTLRMFLFCGISTVFWGILFGSYFGDLLDVVSESFFGYKVMIPPLWFFPVNDPMKMLIFSMLLGIIHILTGLLVKLYIAVKNKDYKTIVYDVVFWFLLLISSIIILLSTQMVKDISNLDLGISSGLVKICSIIAIICSIGIVLTNGRESKNPFKRILKGAYALYGISGYLSDVLSYSRLLALGLATGIICNVINKMAGMASGGPLGVVFFILIVILGHTLNIGINALGAYVHTNRLQYVEFFGKFYGGGGRLFNAFRQKTKYYKFKENIKDGII
jgi:V/A-type H+/Na+-transporting ATPase subunit I